MYWAAAFLPSSLPRSAMVTSPLESGTGEAPVRRARFVRIEASSILAAASLAAFDAGVSATEASLAGCAAAVWTLPAPSSPAPWRPPQLVRSAPSTRQSRHPSIVSVMRSRSFLRLTFAPLTSLAHRRSQPEQLPTGSKSRRVSLFAFFVHFIFLYVFLGDGR